ncbi:MAG: L-aspartate oxidase [Acidimicrobiia bacterium]|nr:L-aspartate oxidase [Acidimicrobiia bacterium]
MTPAGPDGRAGSGTRSDVVVIGGGVAGIAASRAASAAGRRVRLITKESLDDSSTRYAQGGVAAALSWPDRPELHMEDTMAAGAGHCDPDAVRVLVEEGPRRVSELLAAGARFDRDRGGALALAQEGGHRMRRILRAGGDATGAEVQRLMGDLVRESTVELVQDFRALDLVLDAGRCTGVLAVDHDANRVQIAADAVVLATGGAGALYTVTTNPDVATADGIAMAMRAGAVVADMAFLQFHPTALVVEGRPRPLISEAVRGEGAVLRGADGSRFMEQAHPLADLAPRDVVSRAVYRRMLADGADHVWLDATGVTDFAQRFPTISSTCRRHGLDPGADWLPVAPAAHYYCGGVRTDLSGRTSVPGLWAAGEVACTGLNGANRLASNSLLEGLVFGHRVGVLLGDGAAAEASHAEGAARERGELLMELDDEVQSPPRAGLAEGGSATGVIADLQAAMTLGCGVVRAREGLERTRKELAHLAPRAAAAADPAAQNLLLAADALAISASMREETRGCHVREDFPETQERWAFRLFQRRRDGRIEVFR